MAPVKLLSIMLLLGSGALLGGCSINPATGTADMVFTSEAGEIKLGQQEHQKLSKTVSFYEEPKLQAYVEQLGQKLAAVADRPELDYHFFIIDSPDINAFALPGGYVYINRGLLAYLHNEAQLAAVLAHEIAHITARHALRQQSGRVGAQTASVLGAVLTRSNSVGQAVSLYTHAAVKGYGRDMELEADGFGAEYLARAGYPSSAMLEVIGILKDHETYQRRKAKASGRKPVAYHGVFSSHPRNDKRLRELVGKAGSNSGQLGSQAFRQAVNGMVYGRNYASATVGQLASGDEASSEQRYRHNSLGFSFAYPEGWQVTQNKSSIDAASGDNSASLQLLAERHQGAKPEAWLRQRFGVALLRQSEPLVQEGLLGHSGIEQQADRGQRRIAVLYKGGLAYVFASSWHPQSDFERADEDFMGMVRSFRPERRQRSGGSTKKLFFVKANNNTRFADIARKARLGRSGEDQLRLINGYYPSGEPRPGQIIKVVQ
ncbi:MAG: M48 family metalloprotease [Cellvibrionaceae bacterium]|nr:M48 family metalloprotease [Cellvibrionaceae bacterium]